jgi:hypothetical protein
LGDVLEHLHFITGLVPVISLSATLCPHPEEPAEAGVSKEVPALSELSFEMA